MAAASPLKLRIEGMDCGACAVKIESALRPLPGVFDISVSYSQASLSLMLDEDRTSRAAVETRIKALGFTPHGADDATARQNDSAQPAMESAWWATRKGRLVIGTGVMLALAYAVSHMEPASSLWTYMAAALVGLAPIARRALAVAGAGAPFGIETLMSIAVVGALAIGGRERRPSLFFSSAWASSWKASPPAELGPGSRH
jgi:Cd2+/Zn2+-exporting ATPase